MRHVRVIIVAVGNKITNSGCTSVALGILHAKRIRRIILLSEACLTVPYFSTLSRKRQVLKKPAFEYKICGLIFSTIF